MTEGTTTYALQQILDRLLAGDTKARDDLINRAYNRLTILTRKLLGKFEGVRLEEETTGVLSDAYLRLHTSLEEVKPTSVRQFMGLASLEIQRVLLDRIRKMKGRGKTKRPPKTSIDAASPGADGEKGFDLPDAKLSNMDLAIDLLEAIAGLADEEREVVQLLYFHGYTQAEAGELLEVHEDTVKRRWARARVKLAGKLSAFE